MVGSVSGHRHKDKESIDLTPHTCHHPTPPPPAFTFCEDAMLEKLGAQDREGPSPRVRGPEVVGMGGMRPGGEV